MSFLSRHEANIRLILTAIGAIAALFFTPLITLGCIVLLSLAYRSYEALFLGLLVDFMWQPLGIAHPYPLYTLAAFAVVWLFEPIRSQLLQ